MDESERWIESALAALTSEPVPPHSGRPHVPGTLGLYAIYSMASVWRELSLGNPPDSRPLYVGKSESNLISRDVKTHFQDGRTGWSIVRRSFAALLHDSLGLAGIPRNLAKPGMFDRFGLSEKDDPKLTAWMQRKLVLATWSKPSDCLSPLRDIERDVIGELEPPLNLAGVLTPWTAQVKAARKLLAAEARAFSAGSARGA
jgi:hypothetical protein